MRSGVPAGADGAAAGAFGPTSSSTIFGDRNRFSKITLEKEQNMIRRTDHVLR
jgi:hypothetical protein